MQAASATHPKISRVLVLEISPYFDSNLINAVPLSTLYVTSWAIIDGDEVVSVKHSIITNPPVRIAPAARSSKPAVAFFLMVFLQFLFNLFFMESKSFIASSLLWVNPSLSLVVWRTVLGCSVS